jgi:hypothetical protein
VFLGGAAFSSATFQWNASASTVESTLEAQLGYDISVARRDVREGLQLGLAWNISHRWQLKDNVTEVAARAASDVPAYAQVESFLATREWHKPRVRTFACQQQHGFWLAYGCYVLLRVTIMARPVLDLVLTS